MLKILLLTFSFTFSLQLWSQVLPQDKFNSYHSIAVDGVIEEGKIYSSSSNENTIHNEIHQQLYYTVGQLNGTDGVADLNRAQVEILSIDETDEEQLYLITYKAKLFIAWPRYLPIPSVYQLVLPAYGNWFQLIQFYNLFAEDEAGKKLCLDYHAHDYSSDIFWYYYRPFTYNCPLKDASKRPEKTVVTLDINLKKSLENTTEKYPEYHQIWKDKTLKATMIFGMNEADGDESDPGVQSYNSMYRLILHYFNTPFYSNVTLQTGEQPGLKNPTVHLKFHTPKGEVDILLLLISGIRSVDNEFRELYNQRTLSSDYISYSGHSGLGANIRAMARMGQFARGQYQLFFINGCDTFAYVDDSLRNAHQKVNPDFSADKFIDIITNAMPSYFSYNAHSNMVILKALYEEGKTYQEILRNFSSTQKAVVTGEQDNRYPLPFYEE